MNDIINQMKNRASVRSYKKGHSLSKEQLDSIIEATVQSPTYIGAQQYSILVIDDKKDRELLLELTKGSNDKVQQHIGDCSSFLLFVVDFNKVDEALKFEEQNLEITNYFESLLIGSVDVGIAVEAATVAAESMGLGTVMIGAVRRNSKKIIEHFNLPALTFPMVGLCIGEKASQVEPKPRLPKEAMVHYNRYTNPNWSLVLEVYNKTLNQYYLKNYSVYSFKWTAFVNSYYSKGYWEDLSQVYKEQGFGIK